jgi:deoxycytidine triphosphate deaminase
MRQILHHELRDFAHHYVDNIDHTWLGAFDLPDPDVVTELNVRLGTTVYFENHKRKTDPQHEANPKNWTNLWSQYLLSEHEPLIIEPGQFVLAETLEKFAMPKTYKGLFTLRSWAAKSGLDQAVSITLKPNWSGHLIMELHNNLQHTALCLRPHEAIGQIEFFELSF